MRPRRTAAPKVYGQDVDDKMPAGRETVKEALEHAQAFLMDCTPAELDRVAREFVNELYELKEQRCGDSVTREGMAEILQLKAEKWNLFAHLVNSMLGHPLVDPLMFRETIRVVLLAIRAEQDERAVRGAKMPIPPGWWTVILSQPPCPN